MFTFADPRPRRRPSLTPMIDVVFLLLVFFMLAARFGQDTGLRLNPAAGGDEAWQGAPRLVQVRPDMVLLNGGPVALDDLADRLAPLMPDAQATVLLRAEAGADLGRLVAVIDTLRAAGLAQLAIVE